MTESFFISFYSCAISVGRTRPNVTDIALVILAIVGALISFVVFRINISKNVRNSKKIIGMLERKDSAWKYNEICKQAENTYYAVHNMLLTADVSSISKYATADFCKEFSKNLLFKQAKKNHSQKVKLKEIVPVAVYDDTNDDLDFVWFYVKGRSTNCSIDDAISEQITDNARKSTTGEYWQFVRGDSRWLLNKVIQANEVDDISSLK